MPEDRDATVSGIDPAVVLHLEVALRDREYCAIGGARRTGVAASLWVRQRTEAGGEPA